MKQRILPFGFLSLLLMGFTAFLISNAVADNKDKDNSAKSVKNEGAIDYLASIRNNQHSGVINPADVIKARQQAANQKTLKSGQAFTWKNIGPDNMGGRTRAVIFDNQDPSANTIYAGTTMGGIFKSTNLGSNWTKINNDGAAGLNVTSMVQHSNGTIYVGTGEGFSAQDYTGSGYYGYEGGFLGKGIFKSGANDNFTQIPSTKPVIGEETTEWGYINDLAIDETGGRLFAATNTGLKVASLSDLTTWQSEFKYMLDSIIYNRSISIDSMVTCDSFAIVDGEIKAYGSTGWQVTITDNDTSSEEIIFREYVPFEEYTNCYDVKVSDNGWVITTFGEKIFVSADGDLNKFESKSIYPENEESVRFDNINWSAHIVLKDKQGNTLLDSVANTVEIYEWHTDYYFGEGQSVDGYPEFEDGGRTEFAIAPSNQDMVYAQVSRGASPDRNSLMGIYLSEDAGQSWRVVAPGGSNLVNVLGAIPYQGINSYFVGDFANTISVLPNDPSRIIAGGVNLWYGRQINATGYYAWDIKSTGQATSVVDGIFDDQYCHSLHHSYTFRPGTGNQFIAATSGGLYLGKINSNNFVFQSLNKNFVSAQFLTLDISNMAEEYVGGTQDNGPLYNEGKGGTGKSAIDMWRPQNADTRYPIGTNGGSVALSTIRSVSAAGDVIDPPSFYSISPFPEIYESLDERIRRSETLGYDFSANDISTSISDERYMAPMLLWESYHDTYSQIMIKWNASENYSAGDSIIVRSNLMSQPFYHVLENDIVAGDSLEIQDVITSKLFMGVEDEVWMTLEGLDFGVEPEWFLISERTSNGVDGVVQSMAYSADGNYLWVGTAEGKLYRLSGIAFAYNYDKADVNSSNCVIATTEVMIGDENTQSITSIAVDPKNADKVIVTLGNYGNTDYVYYCTNGTGDVPSFASVQGNLPTVPVYTSLLEYNPETNVALIGTDLGLYASDNVASGNWYFAAEEIGEIPVTAIKQQTLWKGTFVLTIFDPGTGQPFYETFPGIQNYQDIFVATYGRGVFKYDTQEVGIKENPDKETSQINFEVFPNPASDNIAVEININSRTNLTVGIYDLAGKQVLIQEFGETIVGLNNVQVNLASLQKGTYLIRVTAGNQSGTNKLIVIK